MIPRALAAGQPKAPLPRRGTDAITPGPIYFDVDRMSRLLHGGLLRTLNRSHLAQVLDATYVSVTQWLSRRPSTSIGSHCSLNRYTRWSTVSIPLQHGS